MTQTGPDGRLHGSLGRRDALFHAAAFRDATWTETNWFGFFVPQATLRGSVYVIFRTNLGVARAAVMAYSRPCGSVLDLDYVDDRVHLPMGPDNLDDYRLGTGLRVTMVDPMRRWTLRYEGRSGTVFDLVLDAHGPALLATETHVAGSGPGYAVFHRPGTEAPTGHIDQTMWVTGEVRIGGVTRQVDFASNRDHSWSPRREWGHNICGNFDEAHFGRELSVHVQTRNEPIDQGTVTHGYVVRDGAAFALVAGTGRYRYDGWRITDVSYDLQDAAGRTYRIDGTPVAWTTDLVSGSYAVTAVVRWTWEGEVGWGDYKWHWDLFRMREHGMPGSATETGPGPATETG